MALTLPSSKENSFYIDSSNHNNSNSNNNNRVNAHYNGGGLTQTTATLTPTRLKNIEEAFLEHSILPPKPFQHQHMAGFVTPTVNISFNIKPTAFVVNQAQANSQQQQQSQIILPQQQLSSLEQNSRREQFYSNSNDSYPYSDDCSSEANSVSVPEDYSFGHFNMNVSKSKKATAANATGSGGRNTKKSNVSKRKQNQNNNNLSTSSTVDSSSQQATVKPSKSRGGRKPAKSSKLTPEEELKRAKRRERNKQAAARCRKRRLDQTNQLLEETNECENVNKGLIDHLNNQLNLLSKLQNLVEIHESHYCKRKMRMLPRTLTAAIDYDRIQNAMKVIPTEEGEEDDDDDMTSMMNDDNSTSDITMQSSSRANSFSNNNNNSALSQQFNNNNNNTSGEMSIDLKPDTPNSVKRKRPNSLSITRTFKTESNEGFNFPMNNPGTTNTAGISTSTTTTTTLQTPSSGMFFDNCFEPGSGLTPLVPTLTTSLTPSSMEAFIKSLSSPMSDDSKRLILI